MKKESATIKLKINANSYELKAILLKNYTKHYFWVFC